MTPANYNAAAAAEAGGAAAAGGQFGDTTYTKVFVGGLAWETQRHTMKKYFEQFGEILEAVVITDKNSGRSKGYGFVTFREPEAAMRACVDPSPVIDGRRANCNLASLGVQRSKPSATPLHGGSRNFRAMKSFQAGLQGGLGAAFATPAPAAAAAATFPHYGIQQGLPYYVYGFSPYSAEYNYAACDLQSYYNVYGGGQYPLYGGAAAAAGMVSGTAAYYPYFQGGAAGGGGGAGYAQGQGYGVPQYPQMFQYSAVATSGFAAQLYGGPLSLAPTPAAQAGMSTAPAAPTWSTTPAAAAPPPPHRHYRLVVPPHFVTAATTATTTTAPEQPLP